MVLKQKIHFDRWVGSGLWNPEISGFIPFVSMREFAEVHYLGIERYRCKLSVVRMLYPRTLIYKTVWAVHKSCFEQSAVGSVHANEITFRKQSASFKTSSAFLAVNTTSRGIGSNFREVWETCVRCGCSNNPSSCDLYHLLIVFGTLCQKHVPSFH